MDTIFEMSIQYSKEVFEKIQYIVYKAKREKQTKTTCIVALICMLVLINVMTKDVYELKNGLVIMLTLNLILCIAGLVVVLRVTRAHNIVTLEVKKMIRDMKDPFQKVEYQFREDSYIVKTPVSITEYKYDAIEELMESNELFFIFLGKLQVLCMEKNSLVDGQIDEMETFLEKKTNLSVRKVAI